MIENEDVLYEELDSKQKELINYGALMTLISYGIPVMKEKYYEDYQIAFGCYSAVHFLQDKMNDCLKTIQATRELLGIELLPENSIEAAVQLGKELLNEQDTSKTYLQ